MSARCASLIYWSQSEPAPGVFDWRATDAFLISTSRDGFERLPVIWGSPAWLARTGSDHRCRFTADRCAALQMPVHSPAQRRAWSRFLRALVGRYGPAGTFWELHPELPRDPIRTWQIWNEENDHRFAEASVRDYAALLRGSAPAIRSVDPDARIILGGLYATPRVRAVARRDDLSQPPLPLQGHQGPLRWGRPSPLRRRPEA